jgi:NAD(P)-dependent dehydrogenase (short-subunit alcohol dehydrogenase family)
MTSSVVVTGSGKGIGRAIALRLAEDGYYVVGLEVDEASAREVSEQLADRGEVHVGDAAEREDLEQAAALAVQGAPLGAWVNNAGLAISGTLHSPDATEVERLFAVNLMGYFWGSSVAIRHFLAQRSPGAIVNISSIHSRAAFPGWAAYDTAKGGIDALTRYIAVEYGLAGIRANAISPGAIRTPLMQGVLDESPDPEAAERDFGALHPLARLGEPEEIASAAAFLLSKEASFITGENIAVDGGATARCYAFPTNAELQPPLDMS